MVGKLSEQRLTRTQRQILVSQERKEEEKRRIEYQSAVEDYNKKLAEYEKQKKAYDESLARQQAYEQEIADWKEAESLIRRGSRFEGTQSIRDKVAYLREVGIRSAEHNEAINKLYRELREREAVEKPEEPIIVSGAITKIIKPTEEEKKDIEFYKEMYEHGIIAKGFGKIQRGVEPIIMDVSSLWKKIIGRKEPEKEMFEPKIIAPPRRETITYEMKKPEDLSKEAGYYQDILIGESIAGVKFEETLKQQREKLLAGKEVTEVNVELINKNLEEIYKKQIIEYEKGYEKREAIRKEKFFPLPITAKFLPKIDFQSYKAERKAWEKLEKVPGRKIITKTGIGGVSFVYGGYEGLRLEPVKTVITLGTFVALPPALKLVGAVGKATKVSAVIKGYPKATAYIGKGVQYGLGGAYGISVGARVYTTPGEYKKWMEAGKITTTEILPMTAGLKLGAYGVRRVGGKMELLKLERELKITKPEDYKIYVQKKILAKEQIKIQPEIKELDLSRLKLLEEHQGAIAPLEEYIKSQSRLITGGSIAQETQMLKSIKTKRPSDVDIYVKSLFREEALAIKQAEKAGAILREAGVPKVTAKKGKVKIAGEKLIEFHPYKTYLKYNIEQILPFYKTAGWGIVRTPSGAKVMKLSVQRMRKLVGGYLEPFATGKLRLKDIPAEEAIAKMIEYQRVQELSLIYKLPSEQKIMSFIKTEADVIFDIPKGLKTIKTKDIMGEGVRGELSKYFEYKPYKYAKYEPYKYPKELKQQIESYTGIKEVDYSPYVSKVPTPVTTFYEPVKTKTPTIYQPVKIKTPTIYQPVKTTPYVPSYRPPISPPKKITYPTGFLFLLETPKKKPKRKGAFNVLGKPLKQKNYVKLNKVPLTEGRARDVGSYLADTSLARTFKIQPTKGKPKQTKLDVPLGYFNAVKYKLRDHKIRKGKQIPMKDKWIEKSPYALDTYQEVNQINLFKRLSQISRKKKLKKQILFTKMKTQPMNINKILKGIPA